MKFLDLLFCHVLPLGNFTPCGNSAYLYTVKIDRDRNVQLVSNLLSRIISAIQSNIHLSYRGRKFFCP